MSATQTMDVATYLASQTMPTQPDGYGIYDPQWKNMNFLTPVGRFLNINVDQPRAVQSRTGGDTGAPKYAITVGFSPGTQERPIVADLWRAIHEVADLAWPAIESRDPQTMQPVTLKGLQMFNFDEKMGGYHRPIYNGDDKFRSDPQKFESHRGLWFINASMWPQTLAKQPQRPICKRRDGVDCETPDEIRELFYAGCFGRAILRIKAYHNKEFNTHGVSTQLLGVQFVSHGPRIGGGGFNASRAYGDVFAGASLPGEMMDGPNSGPKIGAPAFAMPAQAAPAFPAPTGPIPPNTAAPAVASPGFARPPGML